MNARICLGAGAGLALFLRFSGGGGHIVELDAEEYLAVAFDTDHMSPLPVLGCW